MAEQKPQSPQTHNRRPVIGAIIVIVGLIALVLWQGGSPTQRTAAPEAAAVTEQESAGQDSGAAEAQPAEETEQPAEESGDAEAVEATEEPTQTPEPPQQVSDLSPIAYEELPPEAHDTIELIDQGGPFPYDKDGSTFQNREGVLPDREMGYYSEYTVITPGSSDRGARRIVAGADGELYYTDDHYESFEEVMR